MAFTKGTPKPAGSGRTAGTPNKASADLRSMVFTALDEAGGAEYLFMQAYDNPQAFLTLVGKFVPKDLNIHAKGNLADLLRSARERVGKR